jgi:hypothetical protein
MLRRASVRRSLRAYLLAIGLATLVMGLFLMFAGYVHIGCTVGGNANDPVFSNCSGAIELEVVGAILTVAAGLMFAGTLVPDTSSRYK